jgi:hypothetical protein
MSYKINKYEIIPHAISKDMANFCFNYLLLKRRAVKYMVEAKHIKNKDHRKTTYGHFTDPQVMGVYSCYADPVIETLLMKLLSRMQLTTRIRLIPCYGYTRLYEKGAILPHHVDRKSCEVSATLHLGGDPWIMYLVFKKKTIEVNLTPGDMLVYDGSSIIHGRHRFTGEAHGQAFLHYNNKKGKWGEKNKFDKRPCLGLPFMFRK